MYQTSVKRLDSVTRAVKVQRRSHKEGMDGKRGDVSRGSVLSRPLTFPEKEKNKQKHGLSQIRISECLVCYAVL